MAAAGSGLIASATNGAIATVAMSAVMIVGDRMSLMGEQPPTVITRKALRDLGVDRPSKPAALLAPVAHLGFGVAGGVTYRLTRRFVPRVPGGLLGVAFGLAVWTVSYQGWIPAMGFRPPPEDDRPGRPAVMLAAHVAYGLVLGGLSRPRQIGDSSSSER